jgi:hypothetical protein
VGIAALADEIVADDLAGTRVSQMLPKWQAAPIPVYAIAETRLLPGGSAKLH